MAKNFLNGALLLYLDEAWAAGRPEAELRWARVDGTGKLMDSGDGPPLAVGADTPPAVAIIPAAVARLTEVDAPPKNRKVFLRTLPNVLEAAMCLSAENIHAAAGPWLEGGRLAVAAMDREWMAMALIRLAQMNLALVAMIPETLVIPLADGGWSMTMATGGPFIRTGPLSGHALDTPDGSAPPAGLAMLVEKAVAEGKPPGLIRVYHGPDSPPLEEWAKTLGVRMESAGEWDWRGALAHGAQFPVNLLQGRFAPPAPPVKARPMIFAAMALGLLAAVLHTAALALETGAMRKEKAGLGREIASSLRKAMGGGVLAQKAESTMETRLALLRRRAGHEGRPGMAGLLGAAAGPVKSSAKLKDLSYKTGEMRLTVVMNGGVKSGALNVDLARAGLEFVYLGSRVMDYGEESTFSIKEPL